MIKFFCSATTGAFYPEDMRADYEKAGTWPADAIKLTDAQYLALRAGRDAGKVIVPDSKGKPVLADPQPPAPLTRAEIEQLRLRAYADPVNGSDRYFAEAQRMQFMGEPDWEARRDLGAMRYQEIQAQYPWPASE